MTCKDCIHYDVCSKLCRGIDMNLFMKDDNTTASESCTDFKDKTKYIDLPCKVGDVVYFIHESGKAENFGEKYIDWIIVGRITVSDYGISIYGSNAYADRVFDSKGIGTVCFLTREEAEKALKARERE